MRNLFRLFILIAISFSFSNKVFSISPDIFIQNTVDNASKVLSLNISKDQKIELSDLS